jgi:hypothetical protein
MERTRLKSLLCSRDSIKAMKIINDSLSLKLSHSNKLLLQES